MSGLTPKGTHKKVKNDCFFEKKKKSLESEPGIQDPDLWYSKSLYSLTLP
jgi:hypothetical protein